MLRKELAYLVTEAVKYIWCTILLIVGATKDCEGKVFYRPWFFIAVITPLTPPLWLGLVWLLCLACSEPVQWKKVLCKIEAALFLCFAALTGFGLGVVLYVKGCDAQPIAIATLVLLVCLSVRGFFIAQSVW